MTSARLHRQFMSFVGVGTVGFIVDALLFLVLTRYAQWPIWGSRAVSATCSITTTWLLNRQVTFAERRSSNKQAEYLRYLLVQVVGLGVNLATFAVALMLVPARGSQPVIALAVGAAAALLFNFVTARTLAFRRDAGA